jgi:hypothetical protein
MGMSLKPRLYCDCVESLKVDEMMEVKVLKQINENIFEMIFQCKHCNRSIKLTFRLIYNDYCKGVKVE